MSQTHTHDSTTPGEVVTWHFGGSEKYTNLLSIPYYIAKFI